MSILHNGRPRLFICLFLILLLPACAVPEPQGPPETAATFHQTETGSETAESSGETESGAQAGPYLSETEEFETDGPESETAESAPEESSEASFRMITQDEAAEMMKRDDGHLILDVRMFSEFEAGHIPGAICLPNESIGTEPPPELPDPDQILLVYCRSGRRSKEAAQKLVDLGYTNVFEFGGILDWTGETETE